MRATPGNTAAPTGNTGARLQRWLGKRYPVIIDVIVIAGLWQFSTLFLPPIVAPSLKNIGIAVFDIFSEPQNLLSLVTTGARIFIALIIAFVGGTTLGLLMGALDGVRRYVKPILYVAQGIPGLSWVVFAVIWFSQAELRIGFVLVIITLPAFALYIDSAVRAVNLDLLQLAQAFRASRLQRFRMVVLPAIVPEILSAWTVNLGNGVRVAVVAELMGSTVGVGFQLLQAQSVFNMAGAIAWTLSLVALLLLYQGIIILAEHRLLAWRPKGEIQ
ncbi:MAG: ABC transporter permease subunit [Candidimonas sp.]|nr:MAG: ABC transporter permease subunit [Candidimonas sp.]